MAFNSMVLSTVYFAREEFLITFRLFSSREFLTIAYAYMILR